MAFVASGFPGATVPIAGGSGNVTVPVPQLSDVSGNGFSGNLFSHFQYNGVATAINPATQSVTVAQITGGAPLYFGNVQR
jgi:hypothetical protein